MSIPLAGEEVCGDSWAIDDADGRAVVLVVDGLGHGPQAAEAAREAVRVFRETAPLGPAEVIRDGPRRAAKHAAAPLWRSRASTVSAGKFSSPGSATSPVQSSNPADEASRTSMVSHNGTVGHTIRKIQEFIYPWTPGSLLVMHSDGMATQWQVGRYAGLGTSHPGSRRRGAVQGFQARPRRRHGRGGPRGG